MVDTIVLRKRFCKDNNVSINILKSPYFEERLKLLGKENEYKNFIEMINNIFGGSEEKYLAYYNTLKDDIITFIKESEAFKELNLDDMNKYKCNFDLKQTDVYRASSIGHKFISIDIRKANFSSLVKYGMDNGYKFFDSFDWTEFMKQFTDIEYFFNSKYIRQVVFGNCNPKRQVTYEKYLVSLILTELISSNLISVDRIYSLCSDELIIDTYELSEKRINSIVEMINKLDEQWIPLKVQVFTLGKVNNTEAYVKKIHNENDRLELKCVNPSEAPYIYRFLKGEKPKEIDSYFIENGRLAKFIDDIDISISY